MSVPQPCDARLVRALLIVLGDRSFAARLAAAEWLLAYLLASIPLADRDYVTAGMAQRLPSAVTLLTTPAAGQG